jgi:hypothetical protein
VGLVWRMARRIMAAASRVDETNFVDVDPWLEASSTSAGGTGPPEPTSRPASGSVRERVLKMNSFIDQQDESVLLPDETEEPLLWRRSWLHFTRGSSWRTGHRIPIFRFGHDSRGECAECRSAACTLHEEMALAFSETYQFQAATLLGKRRGTFSKQHA